MPLSTMTKIIFYKPFYFEIISKTAINGEEMGKESIPQMLDTRCFIFIILFNPHSRHIS